MTPAPARHDVDAARTHATDAVQFELVLLLRRVRTRFRQVAQEVHPDVDASGYAILHLVHSGQTSTVTGLAELLGVGKPTVSRQVTALEALGLLQRESAADDRRVVRLSLTDDGAARLTVVRRRRDAELRGLLSDWPVEDLSAFAGLLARFNELQS